MEQIYKRAMDGMEQLEEEKEKKDKDDKYDIFNIKKGLYKRRNVFDEF